MLISYIKIGIRSLLKNRIYGIINIVGLAVGMAGCILIALFVQDEFSYDRFHNNHQNIYRLALERIYPSHTTYYAITPHSFSTVIQEDFPEVESVVRLFSFGNPVVIRYEKENERPVVLEERFVMLADSNFFEVFSIPIIKGNQQTPLHGQNNIVLTESAARRYFKEEDPINKILITGMGEFKVSAICRDVPENSHFRFDILGSINSVDFFNTQNFTGFSAYQYLVLNERADPESLETKFPEMIRKYAGPQIQQNLNITYDEYVDQGNGYHYFLQPLTSIHLHSRLENEMRPNGSISILYIFISISIFILAIACINFINLATARSTERSKEVGVRKTMGSSRFRIIWQFIIEAVITSLLSLVVTVVLINVALPFFNHLAGKNLILDLDSAVFPILILFSITVGIISGIYPALFLSAFNPSEVLKGRFHGGFSGSWLRNALVIFQFFISIALIAGTFIIYQQLRFMQNRALGFNKENVLIIERAFNLNEQFDAFKKELKNYSYVKEVGNSSAMFGRDEFFGAFYQSREGSEVLTTKNILVDNDFIETMDLEIVEGRDFDEMFDDSLSLIINQSAVDAFDLKDPVGATLSMPGGNNNPAITYTIIGVVKDFNFQSLRTQITPLCLLYANGPTQYINVRINQGNLISAIDDIEKKWREQVPEEPFKYSFLDQNLAELYISEQKSGQLLMVFSLLAIIIASIGLFGLAAYTTMQRQKEIGIRKVLGSTVLSIIVLLSKEFSRLIMVSFIIAAPLTYWGMAMWLENFAFKLKLIAIFPAMILSSALISLVIAFITVSYHSIKVALANPVESLRYE